MDTTVCSKETSPVANSIWTVNVLAKNEYPRQIHSVVLSRRTQCLSWQRQRRRSFSRLQRPRNWPSNKQTVHARFPRQMCRDCSRYQSYCQFEPHQHRAKYSIPTTVAEKFLGHSREISAELPPVVIPFPTAGAGDRERCRARKDVADKSILDWWSASVQVLSCHRTSAICTQKSSEGSPIR